MNRLQLRISNSSEIAIRRQVGCGVAFSVIDDPDLERMEVRLSGCMGVSHDRMTADAPVALETRFGRVTFLQPAELIPLCENPAAMALAATDELLLRAAVGSLNSGMRNALGGSVTVVSPGLSPDATDNAIALFITATARDSAAAFTCRAEASAPTASSWLGSMGWRPLANTGAAPELSLGAMHLSVKVLRGVSRISTSTLRSVRCGDALLMDPATDTDGHLTLQVGGMQLSVRRQEDQLELIAAPVTTETISMSPHALPEVEGVAPMDELLDGLDLEVLYVVSSVKMKLAELRALMEGDVVTLPKEAATDAPIEIVANGLSIGRGELIQVDGRLAVEVTWLRRDRS